MSCRDPTRTGRAALRDPDIREVSSSTGGGARSWTRVRSDRSEQGCRHRLRAIAGSGSVSRRSSHPWIEARREGVFRTRTGRRGRARHRCAAPLRGRTRRECDVVLFVDADRALRIRRVAESRGWSEAELTRREDSQMPLDAKRSRADHVLTNNGDLRSSRRAGAARSSSEITQDHRDHSASPKSPLGMTDHPAGRCRCCDARTQERSASDTEGRLPNPADPNSMTLADRFRHPCYTVSAPLDVASCKDTRTKTPTYVHCPSNESDPGATSPSLVPEHAHVIREQEMSTIMATNKKTRRRRKQARTAPPSSP